MFRFIKKWFKKEEPKEEYYVDFHKLRQRELEKDFSMINHDVLFIVKEPPYRWFIHIEKCLEYNELDFAICHLRYWERCCYWSFLDYGYKCDLEPLWRMIKDSKPYKQRLYGQKLERIKADFE